MDSRLLLKRSFSVPAAVLVACTLSGCLLSGKLDGLTSGATNDAACAGDRGPPGIRVSAKDGSAYCIDSTEVTNAHYKEFVIAKAGATSGQPPECSWNTDFTPTIDTGYPWPPPDHRLNAPVVEADWCDAAAYCRWAGKRLCGRIGGGALASSETKTSQRSEWLTACSKGGERAFPYGDEYDRNACTGDIARDTGSTNVGSRVSCEGGVGGIFDMSGNAEEWIDACASTDGANDDCAVQGGSWEDGEATLSCIGSARVFKRSYGWRSRGFRCCADIK